MPATLADGGPFVLCHWQNPALVAAFAHGAQADRSHAHGPGAITDALATHAPDGAHDHDASQHDSWSHCPLGVGVAGGPLPVDHHFAFTPPSQAAAQHE
jgi:hypothetical protein